VAIVGIWLVWVIADAAVSMLRAGQDAVSALQSSTAPAPQLDTLAADPLLADVRLPPVNCALPPFGTDPTGLRSYYGSLVDCLDAAWHRVLRTAGLSVGTPSINIAARPGQTPCGNRDDEDDYLAWYCDRSQTMYLPIDRMTAKGADQAALHLAVVAHEYGHHVQQLSGLLAMASAKTMETGVDSEAAGQIQRRMELQANCFAGMFFGAAAGRRDIPPGLASAAVHDFGAGFPDVAHGSLLSQTVWSDRGYNRGTTAACNTWAAPVAEIG